MGFLKKAAAITSPFMAFALQNPAKAGRPYLDKIPGYGESAYRPYINQGQQVDPMLQSKYTQMGQDPNEFINAIMAQYQQSPQAQYQSQQLNRTAGNAAAAGGYAGTMGDQRQRAELIQALTSQDMQQYLQNVMGAQGQGLAGLQGISNRGFEASGALGDYLGSAASQRAGLEFGGKQSQLGNFSSLLGSLIGAGAGMYGAQQGRMGMEALGRGGNNSGFNGGFNPGGYGGGQRYNNPSAFNWNR